MTRKHFLRPLAELDITKIWIDGAARWGVEQADHYFDSMVTLFDLLSEQPDMARLRREFKPPVRIHIYGSHLVVFETIETGIIITRVLHQRSDILAMLGD